MKRKRIVIGSILKPVDDVRHYHKLALPMAKTNKYDINIIGFNSKNSSTHPNITFDPAFFYPRLSAARFFSPLKFLKKVIKLKPELIVVNTPELLAVTVAYKILFGGKIIYDVQENYRLNILHLSPLSGILTRPFSFFVRTTERLAGRWVDHFFLAEKSYTSLPFVNGRWTILENKALRPERTREPGSQLSTNAPVFLFSGTLSVRYGLREAVDVFKAVKVRVPGSRLHICGKVHDDLTTRYLADVLAADDAITLQGGKDGVPYSDVQRAILNADAGLVFYPDNPAINECFPTKVWEYMSFRLPMIIQPYKSWTTLCLAKKAALVFSHDEDPRHFIETLRQTEFYPLAVDYSDVLWTSEEPKLMDVMSRLTSPIQPV